MTMDIKYRFKWNMIFLGILLVFQIGMLINKVIKAKIFKEDKEWTDIEEYHEVVGRLLMLGFSFKYPEAVLDKYERPNLKGPFKISEMDSKASYDIEMISFIANI